MTDTKHTPGPWWVTDHGVRDVGGYIAHTNPVQRYEGQDERYAREVAQREADKALIAAAPELLDVLGRAVRRLEIAHSNGDSIMREWIVDARAAIAKATQEQPK